jgi:hypothetical protein
VKTDLLLNNICYLFLMSELFLEIYKNSTLNKNVSTLVVEYLTDPPALPFLRELNNETSPLRYDLGLYLFYTKLHIEWWSRKIHYFPCYIRKINDRWYIY